ncbi:zinc finger protein 510-like [Ylistrum balloti]|uniref:zinc finger protein 510-like n=1 Tax=Ylistrum balloti TaxID=509963 RepID=UPI002905D935|nr:zinc finger protein 510-like [Ylistrum balloti]
MDINCGMELHFAETANLEESDFVSSGTGLSETSNLEESDFVSSSTELSDKLNLGANTEAVHHLLVLDQVSPPSRACGDHDGNDKHLSAADFKLDLGPANDLVSAADFPIENSVTDITSDGGTEENSEGYSILNAALEGNPDLKQHMAPSRATVNTIPTLPLGSILPNLQAVQVVPIANLQQLQLLTSARPTNSDSTVAQLLSANQKMGHILQLGSQQTNNPKLIPLLQHENNQVLGLSNLENQKLSIGSNQCSTDASKTVQQLINLQSGSTSAFLLGNLLVLQPVASQLQGNMALNQPSVTSLDPNSSLCVNNTNTTLQPSCATSSNLNTSEALLKKIVPRPSSCTHSVTTGTNLPVQTTLFSVAQTGPSSLHSVNTTGSIQQMHCGKNGNKIEETAAEAASSDKVNQEQDKTDSLKIAGQKNTKIVIYGKTISMTFDCRNKNGVLPSTSCRNKSLNQVIPGVLNSQQGTSTVKTSLVCSGTDSTSSAEKSRIPTVQPNSTVNSSQVKYVSILEPNISSKLPGKANSVQTAVSTSLPVQVQNKSDVDKIMQMNPIKLNLASSLTTCQSTSQDHADPSHTVGQTSQTSEMEQEPMKDVTVIDQTTTLQGSTRHEYRCDLCSASFNRYGNYTRHRMIHTVNTKDDYRYKCQECGRLFLQRCDMKRHMLIHTNEQPFRCNECGRGYIRRSDLVVHMRFHKKEKTFKCVYCSKNFYQSGDLNRHMRNIHLQTSMLTCGHCSRQFVKEATLIRHMQTRHRDIIIKTLKTKTTTSNAENEQEGNPSNINKDTSLNNLMKSEDIEDIIEDVIHSSNCIGNETDDTIHMDETTPITPTCDVETSSGIIQFEGQALSNEIPQTEGQ